MLRTFLNRFCSSTGFFRTWSAESDNLFFLSGFVGSRGRHRYNMQAPWPFIFLNFLARLTFSRKIAVRLHWLQGRFASRQIFWRPWINIFNNKLITLLVSATSLWAYCCWRPLVVCPWLASVANIYRDPWFDNFSEKRSAVFLHK